MANTFKKCILFFTILFFVKDIIAQPLNGNYTINPAGAATTTNFKNIASAIAYMQGGSRTDAGPNNAGPFGVSGPVVFNLSSGTYNERLTITTAISGSSAANTVTFKSFLNDSINTIINGTGGFNPAYNASINIINNSNIIISKLKLIGGVHFQHQTLTTAAMNNIIVSNNNITGGVNIVNGNDNKVINNYIQGGVQMGTLSGATTPPNATNCDISGNTIDGAGLDYNGMTLTIRFIKTTKPTLTGNTFLNIAGGYSSGSGNGHVHGMIYVENCTDTLFIKNNKFDGYTSRLIGYGSSTTVKPSHTAIYNNFFTGSQFNFNIVGSGGVDLFMAGQPPANTVAFNFNNTNCEIFEMGNVDYLEIKNNNFKSAVTTAGYASVFLGRLTNNVAVAKNNNYYKEGGTAGLSIFNNTTLNAVMFNTVAAAQAAYPGFDANGISTNPKYKTLTDLHVSHPALLAAGIPTPTANPILIDIDNDIRNSITPCIGADEFQVNSNDVKLDTVDVQKQDFAAATPNPIKVKFTNKGAATLNQLQINYSIDGVTQPPYAWTGTLAYDSSTTFVTIGSPLFPMLKLNNLRVWTSLPNAAPDQNLLDDSINNIKVIPYTRGVFTIGGTTPTFNNFNHLDSILKRSGVDSAVIVNIRNGVYNEQVTFSKVRNASLTNLITIKGENNNATLDTIAFLPTAVSSINNATVYLDSTQFTVFKHITFQDRNLATVTDNTVAVKARQSSNNITFDSCVFTRLAISTNATAGTMLSSQSPILLNNLKVLNSTFNNGGNGVNVFAANAFIKGNTFKQLYSNGCIAISDNIANSFVTIDSNTVIGNSQICSFFFGGICYGYITPTIGGIVYNTSSPANNITVNISRNNINTSRAASGITTSAGNAAYPVKIYNNMLSNYNTYGINVGSFTELMHNSLSDSNGLAISLNISGNNIKAKNNIFQGGIKNGTTTNFNGNVTFASIASTAIASSNLDFDNNAYGIPDTTKMFSFTNLKYSLSQWQTLHNKDINGKRLAGSIFIDYNKNLHIDKNLQDASVVYNAGTPIAYVPKDIDDSTRNTITPSIGADEFALNNIDAGVFSVAKNGAGVVVLGNNNFVAVVKNYGLTNLTNATLNWSVNGVLQTPTGFTGNLATAQTSTVSLGTYNFPSLGLYTIKAWTTIGGDNNIINDTATIQVRPAMCGTYTIGGTTPSFTTTDSCAKYLGLAGVSCPVVINIRNGNYPTQLTLNSIAGTDATNTVTFASENADSSLVKLGNIIMNGADFVRFDKLSVEFPANSTLYGIAFSNNATNNIITNCAIKSTTAYFGSRGVDFAGGLTIAATDFRDTMNTIKNCRFENISYGVYIRQAKQITIDNNRFIKPMGYTSQFGAAYSIYGSYYLPNLVISNNLIDTVVGTASIYQGGIYLTAGQYKANIFNNRIRVKGMYGINIDYAAGQNATNPLLIYNNFITATAYNTNPCGGVFGNGSGNVIFANNSVLQTGNFTSAYPFSASGITSINNNYVSSTTSILQANGTYDNYWANGAVTVTGTNKSKNPSYISTYDLHATELTLNLGTPLSYVTTDIDGETRSATIPFIGADEIVLVANDAGILQLSAPLKPFAAGVQNVQATIKNYGATNLTSATINWSINGVAQTAFSYTGNLATTATQVVTIGTYNFAINNAYNIKIWSSLPNGTTDGSANNDTILVLNHYAALNGAYTIGGVSPDFPTFNLANTNLKNGGVLGNVILNARDGVYNETLVLDSIPFQNNNTVTWQSESLDSTKAELKYTGVISDGISDVLAFKNSKNQIIKHLTVKLKNNATALTFGLGSSTANNVISFIDKNVNIKLLNNRIVDSTYGVSPGYESYSRIINSSYSFTGTAYDSIVKIQNNNLIQIGNSRYTAIELGSTGTSVAKKQYRILFDNNRLRIPNTTVRGLAILSEDTAVVTKNNMQGATSIKANNYMLIDGNQMSFFGRNDIALNINAGTGRAAGKPVIVTNNMIQATVLGTFNGTYVNNIGVSFNGDRIYFAHNTVATSDTGYTVGYTYGSAINFSGTRDTLINNIFYNNANGYILTTNIPANSVSNNNLFFGTRIHPSAFTLAQWKTFSGQDANSVANIDPYFRGVDDLHGSNILIKTCPAITRVPQDIDGTVRAATTAYGADEFLQPVNDAVITDYTPKKIFPQGNNNVGVTIYNNGSAPITSLNFVVDLKNYPNATTTGVASGNFNYSFTGNIAPGASQTIALGSLTVPIHRNELKINNTLTNGVADDVPFTDTLQNNAFYCGLNGNYTFNHQLSNGDFDNFRWITDQLKFGGVYGPSTLTKLTGFANGTWWIDSIPNRGVLSPLLITSQNSDSATTGISSTMGPIFTLNKASYVTISKLGFKTTSTNTATGHMASVVIGDNNSFQNCYFQNLNSLNQPIYGTYQNAASLFVGAQSNLKIQNCRFDTSWIGICINGVYGTSSPTTDCSITNNIFNKQSAASIYAELGNNLNISKNEIKAESNLNLASFTMDPLDVYKAIFVRAQQGKLRITNNKIHHTEDGYGIYAYYYYSPDSAIINNNFVTIGKSGKAVGLEAIGANLMIYHNSINNLSTNANATTFKFNGGNSDVYNNIFFSKSNAMAVDITKSSGYIANNNLLKTSGSILGKVNGTSYTTLPLLAAGGSTELNSVTGDPLFVSDTDLHVDGAIANNNGFVLGATMAPLDVDLEARHPSTPDIGADEFTLPNYGAVQLESPLSSCEHTNAEQLKVWVKNFGTQTRNRIPVAYRVNGGTIIRDTANVTLNAGDSALVIFSQTVNMAPAINYDFEIWTSYRGDSLPSNDTLKIQVVTTSASNVLPYYTGFEGSPNGWYSAGQNTSWKWGVIYSGVIDSAANGLNAWKTNLTGPHNNGENSYLYSPCFDLSSVTIDPTLNFNLTYQMENLMDKAWVEWSSNAGSTWTKLGTQGQGLGWYNNAGNYWTGVKQGWSNAKYILPISVLGDKSKIRIRFVVQTNNNNVADGFAIDDVSIYTGANPPVSSGTYMNRTGTSNGSAIFIPINDPSGNRLIELNDNGNTLGTITVDVNQNTSGNPTLYNGQYFLGRNFVIRVQNQPTSPVRVRLFITQAEFDALNAANPAIGQVRSLGVYQYSNSILEDFSLANNTGSTNINIMPAQITKIPYLDGYFLEFSVSSFSEFWIGSSLPPSSCLGNGISFSASSSGSTYQWQVDSGGGYNNISNNANYNGTSSATLQINNVPTSITGYKYRCVVDATNGPDNILRFVLTWTGATNTNWAVPTNWSCNTLPDEFTDVVIPSGVTNYPTISANTSVRKLNVQTGTTLNVSTGINLDIKGK